MGLTPINVIFAHEKHGHYVVRTEENTVDSAAYKLLVERVDSGYFYYDEDADRARAAVDAYLAGDKGAAWDFLSDRSDYEYEYVEAGTI